MFISGKVADERGLSPKPLVAQLPFQIDALANQLAFIISDYHLLWVCSRSFLEGDVVNRKHIFETVPVVLAWVDLFKHVPTVVTEARHDDDGVKSESGEAEGSVVVVEDQKSDKDDGEIRPGNMCWDLLSHPEGCPPFRMTNPLAQRPKKAIINTINFR